jgi:hypothetical protein
VPIQSLILGARELHPGFQSSEYVLGRESVEGTGGAVTPALGCCIATRCVARESKYGIASPPLILPLSIRRSFVIFNTQAGFYYISPIHCQFDRCGTPTANPTRDSPSSCAGRNQADRESYICVSAKAAKAPLACPSVTLAFAARSRFSLIIVLQHSLSQILYCFFSIHKAFSVTATNPTEG